MHAGVLAGVHVCATTRSHQALGRGTRYQRGQAHRRDLL
jgi:hypothetical protein